MPEKFTLQIDQDETGVWFVTSEELNLFMAVLDLGDGLARIPGVIERFTKRETK